ncbi:copper-translocating P-type ATPase [Nannocystis sp. ILAH1]|uniref:copper-transporting P-type ATPase n=1 Tax=Nannocystis sp. ILAH1 TaxID=2996789 RepID=UPI00320A0E57
MAREPGHPAPKAPLAGRDSDQGAYTCTNHPEVRQPGLGTCPKCGMPLEPVGASAALRRLEWVCPVHPHMLRSEPGICPLCGTALEPHGVPRTGIEESGDLRAIKRRLWVAALLTTPLLLLAALDLSSTHGALAWPGTPVLVQVVLASPVCTWAAWPFYARTSLSWRSRRLDVFTLAGLGAVVAYGYSLVAAFVPQVFPSAFRSQDGQVAVHFAAASVFVTLGLLGRVLELLARHRPGAAVRRMLDTAAQSARRLAQDGSEEEVPLEVVRVGDCLRVRPGDKVPVDGIVLEGHSFVDESIVTGDPIAAEKRAGDFVIGSTHNGGGALVVRAERVGADVLLARIVAMVAEGRRTRAPIQRLADVVAAYLVPVLAGLAGLTLLVWGAWGPEPRMAYALIHATSVLIVACPCALALATPMSIMVAAGRAATAGVLFKNAEAMEMMRRVDTLVVDKTGTLTEGRPKLAAIVATAEMDEAGILRLAASLERGSEHPGAAAIVEGAASRRLELAAAEQLTAIPGEGVTGVVDGRRVAVGNLTLMRRLGVAPGSNVEHAHTLRAEGHTVMLVAVDGTIVGLVDVSDPIKASTAEAMAALRAEGLRVVMITGDDWTTADVLARKLGIDEVMAGVGPDQKAGAVARLQAQGRLVAVAGDGIDDAPALARAQVGLAMGTGADLARDSADITLVKGDLRGVVRARRLSRAAIGNVKQNLILASIYNAAAIPIAAGILHPAFGRLLDPGVVLAVMLLGSVSVIANALRLRRLRL